MRLEQQLLIITCMISATGPAGAVQNPFFQDIVRPEIYARAEDRERARLLLTPCKPSDVGQGCRMSGARALRETPCSYRTSENVIESIPTDQCYRMDPPRRFSGVFIDGFEDQRFIPDDPVPSASSTPRPAIATAHEQNERLPAARIWLDTRTIDVKRSLRSQRYRIEFIGRQTRFAGAYGHMGMFRQYIIADRLLSIKPT